MIIAHDLGTTGNKATLVDTDGRLLASVTVPYPVDFGPGGRAEQDAEDWWGAVCRATSELLERTGRAATDVEVVSFSGQMMGAVLVDEANDPLRPAIIWADTRSTAQTERLVERVGMDRAYAITGHRLNATYTLPKIAWLRENEPAVFARAAAVLLPKDFIVARLTGVRVTDPSDASGTDAYDQSAGDWSAELLEAAEVDRALLPAIVPSTTVVGRVTAEAARATGLAAGTPVVLGGGDGPMAALGAGIVDAASGAYAYLGSSSWVSVSSDAPVLDPLMRTMTFNHVIPGRFVPTATMQAGGASLQWVTDVLAPGQDDRYERLLEAAEVEAAVDGLFFLPHLLGERSPYWNPRARAAFVGLQMQHGRGHLVRSVLEGVAFNLHTGLRAFVEAGVPVSGVDAIGGAAHAELLLRVFADVWGVPVSSRDLVDEATSVGAAVVGGVGVGIFPDFEVARTMSSRTARREPDAERSRLYADAYPQFLDAYQRLEPWFEQVSQR